MPGFERSPRSVMVIIILESRDSPSHRFQSQVEKGTGTCTNARGSPDSRTTSDIGTILLVDTRINLSNRQRLDGCCWYISVSLHRKIAALRSYYYRISLHRASFANERNDLCKLAGHLDHCATSLLPRVPSGGLYDWRRTLV